LPLQPTSAAKPALAAGRPIRQAAMIDVRQLISSVNPGRPPTQFGNDGLDPCITLPRRFTPSLVARFALERIPLRVRDGGVLDDDRFGVFVMIDEISFPQADPVRIQQIVDGWRDGLE